MSHIIDCNTFFGFWPKRKVNTSLGNLLCILERYDVESCISLSLRGIFYDFKEGNEETLSISKKKPTIVPAATIDPRKYYGKGKVVRELVEKEFKIIRLFPDIQNWPLRFAPFYKILEESEEYRMPVMINIPNMPCGGGLGSITEVYNITRENTIPIIISSFDHWYFSEALTILNKSSNLYFETSLFNTPDSFETFISEGGEERLVFGSGTPLYYFSPSLKYLKDAEISERSKNLIFSKNMERMLNL